jgi:hypothetical protein
VAGSNKFEEIDEKQSSNIGHNIITEQDQGQFRGAIVESGTLTHCPAVPEIIATKPVQNQGQV